MRLIDADMTIKNIHERSYIRKALSEIFETIIDEQPTAFDTNEVIQQIEQLRMSYFLTIANTGDRTLNVAYEKVYQALDKSIEIVKRGGKSDK